MKKFFKFPSFKIFGLIIVFELLILSLCFILLACFKVYLYFDYDFNELPLNISIVVTIISFDVIFLIFSAVCLLVKIYFDKSYKD